MAPTQLKLLNQECSLFFRSLEPDVEKRLVFGEGAEKEPAIMLIGEAPGQQEVIEGRPFVGKAGKNLDDFLQTLLIKREEIYISNVVKIRPTKTSRSGRVSNRPPSTEEVELFLPWLLREIALVQPKVLATLGNTALHAFLPKEQSIGKCHGQWHQITIQLQDKPLKTLPLFAMYHPASIIYRPELKAIYQQDLLTLKESLLLSSIMNDN